MKHRILTLCCLFAILLNACGNTKQGVIFTPDSPSAISPASLATPLPTQTSLPTDSPVPFTATTPLLFTPLPKLSKADSLTRAIDFLTSDSNCALPCWWNIIPGKTDMRSAINELLSFSSYQQVNFPHHRTAEFLFEVPESLSSVKLVTVMLTSQGNTVDQIVVTDLKSWKYQIHSLLQTYGVPSSIWIKTYREDYRLPQNTVPFLVALFYRDKGILAVFGEADGQVSGSTIRGCIVGTANLTLWSPNQNLTFEDISAPKKWGDPIMPLEDVTDINTEDFYNRFKSGKSLPCIDTPAELWPAQ